ncbi:hypothetical protein SBOR_7043 [Sclerotinia borealis F-4128]|uniref:Uncharacterized protein n=1 Tax=Sclerotinia borealis (strain F-4128) TaxID=1432307 RepID=W9C9V4_SCLBF|nr:hypothetical protein SBOR_7043 [Sclerotinia borealis F-4128]
MCGDTLITYTIDNIPCGKSKGKGFDETRTKHQKCFLKEGQVLEDGRTFRHGSSRTRHVHEFERDPHGPQVRWERWERKNREQPRMRSDSLEANVSAGEDRMKTETDDGDDGDSHKERDPRVREWQEKTKKSREPRVRIEKEVQKEQPAAGRKTVNHVLCEPPSDDEDLSDDEWPVSEPKIKIDTGDTVPWSSTPSRSFSDPTVANDTSNQATGTSYSRVKSRDDGSYHKGIQAADTWRPPPRIERPTTPFNFATPATGTHTYMNSAPYSRHDTRSPYNGPNTHLGSPKSKSKGSGHGHGKGKAPKHDNYRPHYPAHSPDVKSAFYASAQYQFSTNANGNANANANPNDLPPYSPTSSSLLTPYGLASETAGYSGPSGYAPLPFGDLSTASGYIGYGPAYADNRSVYGNFGAVESYEREKRNVGGEKNGNGDRDRGEEVSGARKLIGEHMSDVMDEDAKKAVENTHAHRAQNDVEMGGE